MAQTGKQLFCKLDALGSNPSPTKKKKEEEEEATCSFV
jgi:hypothetical protein